MSNGKDLQETLAERIRVYRAGIEKLNSKPLTENAHITLIKYECTLRELQIIYNTTN